MDKYPDFWSVLLGNGPRGFFFGYVVLAEIAALVMMLWQASQKYKDAEGTPVKWSWTYFLTNNMLIILASLFFVPLFIRLVYEYVPPAAMIFVSIGIGFGYRYLAKLANKYGLLTTNKLSEKVTEKINEKENQAP